MKSGKEALKPSRSRPSLRGAAQPSIATGSSGSLGSSKPKANAGKGKAAAPSKAVAVMVDIGPAKAVNADSKEPGKVSLKMHYCSSQFVTYMHINPPFAGDLVEVRLLFCIMDAY